MRDCIRRRCLSLTLVFEEIRDRSTAKLRSWDEAIRIVADIAKSPELRRIYASPVKTRGSFTRSKVSLTSLLANQERNINRAIAYVLRKRGQLLLVHPFREIALNLV